MTDERIKQMQDELNDWAGNKREPYIPELLVDLNLLKKYDSLPEGISYKVCKRINEYEDLYSWSAYMGLVSKININEAPEEEKVMIDRIEQNRSYLDGEYIPPIQRGYNLLHWIQKSHEEYDEK